VKTLCNDQTTVSLYSFDDSEIVIQGDERTTVGDPVQWAIGDCNISNSTLYVYVTLPDNWKPSKYLFDGSNWALNPDYIEPPADSGS
jgi:hypothetical protein